MISKEEAERSISNYMRVVVENIQERTNPGFTWDFVVDYLDCQLSLRHDESGNTVSANVDLTAPDLSATKWEGAFTTLVIWWRRLYGAEEILKDD